MTIASEAGSNDHRDEAYAQAEGGDLFGLIEAVCYARLEEDWTRFVRYVRMSCELAEPADPHQKAIWKLLQDRLRGHLAESPIEPAKIGTYH